MILSPRGEELIEGFEALRLHAYPDQGGVWTLGYGHTAGVKKGDVCTQIQADAWLLAVIGGAVLAVNRSLDVALNQNQFDALVSFTFNLGAGAEAHSTMLRYVNQGQMALAAAEFPKWDHCRGAVDPGLTHRRCVEAALFMEVPA